MKIGQIKSIPAFEFTFQLDAKSMSTKEQNGVLIPICPLNVGDEINVNSIQYLISQKDAMTNPFIYTAKMCNSPLNGMEIVSADKILKENKTTPLKKLMQQHDELCNEIVIKFSNKHELEFDGWVADEIGGIASFIQQYFFNLSDIVLDLRTKQRKGFIIKWQDETTDYHFLTSKTEYINYQSFIKGLRYKDLK